MVGCTNSDCEEWLHYECLLDDVLMRVYEQLGTDKPHKPHKPHESSVKLETDEKAPATLRSTTPAEIKGEETHSPVAVKKGENGDSVPSVPVKQIDGITPKTTESPAPGTPANVNAVEKPSRTSSVKRGRSKKSLESKPYEGLFEASLKLDDGPTAWQVTDLRKDVSGGDRTWTESAKCLFCGIKID